MWADILSVITVIVLIVSLFFAVRKRNRAGITGVKSALSAIFLYLLAVTNLLAYWFNFVGIVSWGISIVLLILAAYFTKYIPKSKVNG
nr:hypothetical protein [Lentibacillus daqui]